MAERGGVMNDIVVTAARLKREAWVLLLCFILATLLNVFAIATRGTEWSELFTQLHVVAALSVVLYLVLGALRVVIFGGWRLIRRS